MQSQYRELLPARPDTGDSSGHSLEDAQAVEGQSERRRRRIIKIACRICQRRRVKCDGKRPGCSACQKRSEVCTYDFNADENTTRYQALKRSIDGLEKSAGQATQVLDLLRSRPEPEALHILGQLRRGVSVEALLASVKESDLLMGLASSSSGGRRDRERTSSIASTGSNGDRLHSSSSRSPNNCITLPPLAAVVAGHSLPSPTLRYSRDLFRIAPISVDDEV